MLGAAILCTTDVLPSFFIRLATVAPVAFRLPLVPAEGLVLSTAGFHNSKQGPVSSMICCCGSRFETHMIVSRILHCLVLPPQDRTN